MDRGRHGALLRTFGLAGTLMASWLSVAGTLRAQAVAVPPTPTATATASATPDAAARKHTAERVQEAQRRIDQLPPEEREAFKRNLRLWRELSPEERDSVRKEADDRMRAEVEKAYQESGLHLDKDRREVFGLRYRQERRKLERELQEKLEAERGHRLPGVLDGLKREFAEKPAATAAPSLATATPATSPASRPTPSVSVPAAR